MIKISDCCLSQESLFLKACSNFTSHPPPTKLQAPTKIFLKPSIRVQIHSTRASFAWSTRATQQQCLQRKQSLPGVSFAFLCSQRLRLTESFLSGPSRHTHSRLEFRSLCQSFARYQHASFMQSLRQGHSNRNPPNGAHHMDRRLFDVRRAPESASLKAIRLIDATSISVTQSSIATKSSIVASTKDRRPFYPTSIGGVCA